MPLFSHEDKAVSIITSMGKLEGKVKRGNLDQISL